MKKQHLYLASSVWLFGVPAEHVAANGGAQFTGVARTTSVKGLAALAGHGSYASLRYMGCRRCDGEPQWEAVAKEPEKIYYQWPRFAQPDDAGSWHEYKLPI